MKNTTSLLLLSLLTLSILPLTAQQQSIQTVEDSRRREAATGDASRTISGDQAAPTLYPGEDQDVGPQYIVKTKPRQYWIQASADSQFFYTDNLLLQEEPTENLATDTTVWVNTVNVAFAPSGLKIADNPFQPRVGFRHSTYFYGLGEDEVLERRWNNFDFDLQTAYVEGTMAFLDTWAVTVGSDFTRLMTHERVGNEFYQEAVPRWAVDKMWQLRDNLILTASYDGNYHVTKVDPMPKSAINDRSDHSLTLALNYEVIPYLRLRPYYRFQVTEYADENTGRDDRRDYLNSLGLTVSYEFNDWSSIRTFIAYDMKDSDDRVIADYDKLDAGLGASVTFRF